MSYKKSEKGQALVLIALAAVGLFAFTALSIDGGMVFSDRRHAQNAADTAALAAALAKLRAPTTPSTAPDAAAKASGLARASTNGYDNNGSTNFVEVHICNEAGITCEGMPAGADPSEYIQVKIISIVRTTFARIVGRTSVTNIVTAIARADVNGLEPPIVGSALVALKPSGPYTISGGGNSQLDINGSGVFDNSSDPCAMGAGGNVTYTVDTSYSFVGAGTLCQIGNSTVNGPPVFASQIKYPPKLDIPTPSINCSVPGSITNDATPDNGHRTVHPGNFPVGLNLNNGTYTFMAGSYCFGGDVSVSGNAHITANFVDIKITAGDIQFNANSTFNCDNVLVYITGTSGGMHFNGTGTNTCTNITFFAEKGSVSWNGNVANTFTATTEGAHPEYANLLIYMPYGNNSPLTINGNAGNTLTGSIIAVSSDVTLSGNSGTTGFNCSITAYTITLEGTSDTTINYNPAQQFVVLHPSTVELSK